MVPWSFGYRTLSRPVYIPSRPVLGQTMPRLLVIDDQPNLQYSLVKSLRSDALEVVTAATAGQGIQALGHSRRSRDSRRPPSRYVGA